MRKVIVVISILATMIPATAKADCTGFMDCLFGFSERVETRQAQMTERERIQAQSAEEIARIQGEAQARIVQAEAEVERVRQMQFESAADRDIAIAQANAKAEEYKAMIAGLTSEKVAGIQSNADTQIAALQAQAQIAVEGITQTGKTERWRVAFGWATVIIGLIIMGAAVLSWMRRQPSGVVMMLPSSQQVARLPWYNESIELIEVKNANAITRKN